MATVEELAADIRAREQPDVEDLPIRLHHVTLPKLAEQGWIDYDPAVQRVWYRADKKARVDTSEEGEQ